MIRVSRDTVSQSPFQLCPDEFVRVQLRRVAGKSLYMQPPVVAQKLPDRKTSMDGAAVPQQGHGSFQMSQQVLQKTDDLITPNVFVRVQLHVKGQASLPGRYADSRNSRHLGPAPRCGQSRRLAPWCPRLPDARDQQEAAFVEEDQMGAPPFSLFLYAATGISSNAGSPPRFVPAPASPVFGNSTRARPLRAIGSPKCRKHQTCGSPAHPHASGSTDRWSSRRPKGLSPVAFRAVVSALATTGRVGQESDDFRALGHLVFDGSGTSARPNSRMPLVSMRPTGNFGLIAPGGPLRDDAFQGSGDFQGVSCLTA